MQAVEQAAQVGEVHVVGEAGADVVEELAEAPDLVGDLGVGPAHGGGRVAAAEQPVQRRVQLLLLGLLVRLDLLDQQPVHAADLAHRRGGRGGPERVRGAAQLVDAGPDARAAPPGTAWSARRPRRRAVTSASAGRSARSALRITATSISSCSSAPQTAGSRPAAAAPIAASDMRHPGEHALQGDPPGAAGQRGHLAEPVEAVDGEHRVGGLGRGGGAAGAHRDPHVGQGQRGGVVDAVADHDGRRTALLRRGRRRVSPRASGRRAPRPPRSRRRRCRLPRRGHR